MKLFSRKLEASKLKNLFLCGTHNEGEIFVINLDQIVTMSLSKENNFQKDIVLRATNDRKGKSSHKSKRIYINFEMILKL